MNISHLNALSPLDGRYQTKVATLRPIMSEFGLIHYRIKVEIHWLLWLSSERKMRGIPKIDKSTQVKLIAVYNNFNAEQAQEVKRIESQTNHDVKAVEYFIQSKFEHDDDLRKLIPFIHFACTSEDINNLSYALMVRDARQAVMLPIISKIGSQMQAMALQYANCAMLSRTHGQSASPTTMGKEIANFVFRLHRQFRALQRQSISGKINGAVGNFNAHVAAYPEVDWPTVTKDFVESLGLAVNPYTTQIEPHDQLAELLHTLSVLNTILIDCCRDFWGYISLGYLKQKSAANEIGSSTMPHKINPIDFENAEGNLGIANALCEHFSAKLPISRWQRDLTDSTVLRNLGSIFGYSLLAYESLLKGLGKVSVNQQKLSNELNSHWEVLAEAIQTIMRSYNITNAYEQMKDLTRGKDVTQAEIENFISKYPLPSDAKARILALTPHNYTGCAAELAKAIKDIKWDWLTG